MRAVKTKAQRWVLEALLDIRQALPFPLLGLDCDNGGEFIDRELFKYCIKEEVTFTRSRPYRKNDRMKVGRGRAPYRKYARMASAISFGSSSGV